LNITITFYIIERMARLIIIEGSLFGAEFKLGETAIIGRDKANAVFIDDSRASREHSKITKEPDGFYISDMGSSNGTKVNEEKISIRKLKQGDIITVGRTSFRFEEHEPVKKTPLHENKEIVTKEAPRSNKVLTVIIYIILLVGLTLAAKYAGEIVFDKMAKAYQKEVHMKIKWLGHSSFAITDKNGKVIITDPYSPGSVGYPKITVAADIVTVSHTHADHNGAKFLPGAPVVIDKEEGYSGDGVKIQGFPALHDKSGGKERGKDIIFVYEIDGVRIAHLGDLGHILSREQIDKLGKVDILMIPVGGYFTIDAKEATEVMNQIKPKITIPMHYKTDVVDYPIAMVDVFLKGKQNVKRFSSSEVAVEKLPDKPEIWILQYTK
jgi:L-ascorbate metabolism protein UlaG (beta-lactamase superfamily)